MSPSTLQYNASVKPSSDSTLEHDEIRLKEVVDGLWRGKWWVLGVTVLLTACALVAALVVPKTYDATIVISPVSDNAAGGRLGGLSSLASQFGGVASLAGLSMSGDSKRWESLAVLQSEALTQRYIEQNALLPVLFRSDWNPQTGTWKTANEQKRPTLWKASQYFKEDIRSVDSDPKTGIVVMSISWSDPQLAAKWANELVAVTNEYLRSKAIEESERNIAYLNDEARKTDVVETRQAIYGILQAEINRMMLARGRKEYAFKVIDPATAPEKPSSPRPLLWAVLAAIGALAASVFFVFGTVAWRHFR